MKRTASLLFSALLCAASFAATAHAVCFASARSSGSLCPCAIQSASASLHLSLRCSVVSWYSRWNF